YFCVPLSLLTDIRRCVITYRSNLVGRIGKFVQMFAHAEAEVALIATTVQAVACILVLTLVSSCRSFHISRNGTVRFIRDALFQHLWVEHTNETVAELNSVVKKAERLARPVTF